MVHHLTGAQLRDVTCDHTVLPATLHKRTRPALTPAMRADVLDLSTAQG